MRRWTLFLLLVSITPAFSADHQFKVTVEAGKIDRENSPVSVEVTLPKSLTKATSVTVTDAAGKKLLGQLTGLNVLADEAKQEGDMVKGELHFIVPKLAAGEKATYTVSVSDQNAKSGDSFKWVDTSKAKGEGDDYAEQSRELRLEDRPVLRYMYSKLDESTKESRSATFKPYHHVYDPAGNRYVTKGPGGLFPHHRGLYFGFNKCSYGPDLKKQADVWHCNNGESQEHVEFLAEEAGPVLGRHRVKINWRGKDGQVFAVETREMSAYNVPDGTLIEFATKLTTADGKVRLDGDPQHAGFHFRASQDVPDKTKSHTYYVRPDGKGEPGKFRNWPGDKQHVNLPWNALSMVLDDQRYTVAYLDHPENPKESRFSERDYGRFGSYFEYEVTGEKPLKLNYRVWLQAGEMTPEQVAKLDDDFVQEASVKVE